MKIVETKQKEHMFGEVDVREVFTHSCEVYIKIEKDSEPYGVNLRTGYVYTFSPTVPVVLLPNAELHLNK